MKCQKWTGAVTAAGVVSLGSAVRAEETSHPVLTTLASTTLSGYVDTSAIWKLGTDRHDASYTGIPGRVFDGTADKLDGFNLEAVKLVLEKPLEESLLAAGYKVDLVFGPDANYYAGGVLNGNGGSELGADLAIKQAYVTLSIPVGNEINVKLGAFDTLIGYEVFESGNNPNFSRSYGFALEPRNHTGFLATYPVTSWLNVAGGIADTSFGPIDGRNAKAESAKTYLGSAMVTFPESFGPVAGAVLYGGVVSGAPFHSEETATSVYVGGTANTPVTGLSLGAAWDYRDNGPGFGRTAVSHLPTREGPSSAYAVAGYASYALSEKVRVNGRVDYANADPGTFYVLGEAVGALGLPVQREHLIAWTLTLDVRLWDNVITRVEVRWDHSLNGDQPFGNANERNACTLAANVIYQF